MKSSILKTLVLTLTLATLSPLGFSTPNALAESWCPFQFSDCSPAEKAFYITFSPIFIPISASGTTATIVGANHKLTLAQAAIEDAAVFYDTGRLTGILPTLIQDTKKQLASERGLNESSIDDHDAVDHIAEVAASVLD